MCSKSMKIRNCCSLYPGGGEEGELPYNEDGGARRTLEGRVV